MNYFGMSFDEVLNEIPYQLIVFLMSSVPRYKPKDKDEKPKDINDILLGQMNQKKEL